MPNDLISVSAFVCQQVLMDQDGLPSAIRILEVVTVRKLPTAEQAITELFLLVLAKSSKREPHTKILTVEIVNPSGEAKTLATDTAEFGSKGHHKPIGAIITVAFRFYLNTSGLYWINVLLEGEKVATVPLTLQIEVVDAI